MQGKKLFSAAVFERLFDHVFAQGVARALVAGDTPAVDSALVKANASLEAVLEKQAAGPAGPHLSGREQTPAAGLVVTAPAHQPRQPATGQRQRQGAQTGWLPGRIRQAAPQTLIVAE